jgi:hypothetical protein
VDAEEVRDTNEATRTPERKGVESLKSESQGKKRYFSDSQTTRNVKECLTLHKYAGKVSLSAVAGGMSNVESDEHYRVKPAYNGTAREKKFSFPVTFRLLGIVNFFSNAHVYVPFKTDFTVRVGTRKTKPSLERQPARKQEDLHVHPLLQRIHPVML